MNYSEAMSFIHSVEWQGSRPGLERITELSEMMSHPEGSFSAVHVAGTNGKGSFCAMLASVLHAAGYKTGLFTSPYIEFFEERMQINGRMIGRDELADIVTDIAPLCERMSDKPTEFELITAVGFEYFRRNHVDIAVIECGMGGRLDSTNILPPPLLSVITRISLDHVQFLGNTISAIAGEKAGIIKPHSPVLFGGNSPDAEKVISETAESRGCEYRKKDLSKLKNVKYGIDGSVFTYGNYEAVGRGRSPRVPPVQAPQSLLYGIRIPLAGAYQPENAASVIEAVRILNRRGLKISEKALRTGLADVSWKGRFEVLHRDPTVIFDGGHNEEGIAAAVRSAKLCLDRRPVIISGVLRDKDHKKMASEISGIADTVFTVTPSSVRALSAADYADDYTETGVSAHPCCSFSEAVSKGYALAARKGSPLLCVGSLYSYADFKNALKKLTENGGEAT